MDSVFEAAKQSAVQLAEKLKRLDDQKIVLAESCSCGMAVALLGGVPGISQFLCGSAVTYRIPTKATWLGIDPDLIAEHTAESQQTTREMAISVLSNTPEANWSAAITGHLGPNAPVNDGLVYLCVAVKGWDEADTIEEIYISSETQVQLQSTGRVERQTESAAALLNALNHCMNQI